MTATDEDAVRKALPYQQRVLNWLMECFSNEICRDITERNHRFLEESLELVQSTGCTASEAHQLVAYVFARPIGEPLQEAGGVRVTFAALCSAIGIDETVAGETELARVWTKIDKIRAKQLAKPKHSPLPESVAPPLSLPHSGEPVAPEGWQLVPAECTPDMVRAAPWVSNVRHGWKQMLAAAPSPPATQIGGGSAVERFQARVVKMIGEGFRGFHFTAGDKWNVMTTEERCESILQLWDAPKTPLDFKDSYRTAVPKSQRSVAREVIAQIIRDKLGNWSFDINEALPELAIKDAGRAFLALFPTERHEGKEAWSLAEIQMAADSVVQRVCEYDDRTSPEDFPEALLITSSELHAELVRFAQDIGALTSTPDSGKGGRE